MKYDAAILGGGPGGYVAAIKAAQLGGKVLLVEKESLGGVCLNKGCIPTKTLLKCAEVYKTVAKAYQFGVNTENVTFDFKKMMSRKNEVVKTLVSGIKGLMKVNAVEVLTGEGKIIDPSHILVEGKIYEASNIIIATGSRPAMPKITGIDSSSVINSDGLLSMETLPASMVIIGGGVIGIEFGILLSRLGCKVTIVEMMEDILFMADSDVICEVKSILLKNKVDIITSAKVQEINDNKVSYLKNEKIFSVEGEKILIASGRVPVSDCDQLDKLGVKHEKGKIFTDEKMRTNIPGIYAIGDVNGKYMLAHVASAEGIVAVENIFGFTSKMSYKTIPQCIYSHPEAAWVGMSEKEAREKGIDISVGKFPIKANGKSLTEGETAGFVKIITEKKHNEILGVHMVCLHATDMIAEAVLAINMEATAEEIALSIHPHPTISETVMEAAHAALGKAIHSI